MGTKGRGDYNEVMLDHLGTFEAYVESGGVVIWSGATGRSHTPYPDPPFGGTSVYEENDTNDIADPSHPLLDGVDAPFEGLWACHNYFTGIPGDAHVVLTEPESGEPTLYVLERGSGMVIVAGLPWEYTGSGHDDVIQTHLNAVNYAWAD